jgi:hypothetical protein
VKLGLNDTKPNPNIAKAMALYFETTTTGAAGGVIGAPSSTSSVNVNYKHRRGDRVYMIFWSFTRTYSPTGQKTENR